MDVVVTEVAPGVHHARAKHVGWILVTEGATVTLVDSGYPRDRDRLFRSLELVKRRPSEVAAVVLTHGHPDHLGGAEHLREVYGVPVLGHQEEVPNASGTRVEQASERDVLRQAWRPSVLRWSLDIMRLGATRVQRVRELQEFGEETLDVPGRPVAVHTPGHTTGHCALHLPDRGVLLVGDAMMTEHAVCRDSGPQLLPAFFNTDDGLARRSLDRLRPLRADVVVPGHGPAFRGTPERAVELAIAHHATGRRSRDRRG
jgi:glyoxylase-like metal-dependent hydrolase (beta-lactamase superfamily II)